MSTEKGRDDKIKADLVRAEAGECWPFLQILTRPMEVQATVPNHGPLDRDEEIVVTAEMIEDGFRVLRAAALADFLLEADRQTVVDIYRAMARLARDVPSEDSTL